MKIVLSSLLALAALAALAPCATASPSSTVRPSAEVVAIRSVPAPSSTPWTSRRSSTSARAVVDNTIVRRDTAGRVMDAHDGDLVRDPATGWTYLVGTAYECGFALNTPSPWCGVEVYRTKDLARWERVGAVGGLAFDPAPWQAVCAPPASFGCYNPHVVQRPSDGRWVMWINVDGVGRGSTTEASYAVLVADSPAGPYVDTGVRPRLAVDPGDGWLEHGAADVTVDAAGVGWLSYTVITRNPSSGRSSHELAVEELDRTFTTGTGRHVVARAANRGTTPVEMPALFRSPLGVWHMAYSYPAVPYGIGATAVMDAPSPLGPWTNPRTLNGDSCRGQFGTVSTLGSRVVLMTNRWAQPAAGSGLGLVANQRGEVPYFGPLTFSANGGTAIDAHPCVERWTF
jgi:hypothetical protein